MTAASDLAEYEIFHRMPACHLERLASVADWEHVPAGHRFFEEEGHADRFWLIRSGQVMLDLHVPGHGTVIIESLGPGVVLGWSWLFPPYQWRFGAVAAEPVSAVVLDADPVRVMCATDPALGYELTRRFAQVMLDRLQNTRIRLVDMYASPLERRG